MSETYSGNNSFKKIPLLDTSRADWAEGIRQCDPLVSEIAVAGLSAVCHGVREAQVPGLDADALEFGQLFDGAGKFVGDELRKQLTPRFYPPPPHFDLFVAGVEMTKAAFFATRLFQSLPVTNDDYSGQEGMSFVRRRVTLPVQNSSEAGRMLNTRQVRNVQARVFKGAPGSGYSRVELDLAASLITPSSLPTSISTVLSAYIYGDERTVSASITSGERDGDFVHGGYYSTFEHLDPYGRVIVANL